jgi:hypothetical protein
MIFPPLRTFTYFIYLCGSDDLVVFFVFATADVNKPLLFQLVFETVYSTIRQLNRLELAAYEIIVHSLFQVIGLVDI